MLNLKKPCAALALSLMFAACGPRVGGSDFNEGWLFIRDSLAGAEAVKYDVSAWKTVDLPHDFSVEPLPAGENVLGPFSRETKGGRSVGYLPGGTGWYRKTFRLPRTDAGKSVWLVFDGAYMQTDVWVNGRPAASHKNGYTPFVVDITELLNPAGRNNVLAVRVVNYGKNSRWYSGSGLYRGVELFVRNAFHIAQWGTVVTTPDVRAEQARVHLDITQVNDRTEDVQGALQVRLLDPQGVEVASQRVATSVPAAGTAGASLDLAVADPVLWSPDSPALYTAEVRLLSEDDVELDRNETRFGIRTIEVNATEGLKLNGEPLLLKGGCVHHDNGLLGAEAHRTAEYRRVRQLKDAGFNAVRCAHNPPSRHFLDACDELGLLVMDEFTDMWELPKNVDDYAQFFRDNWESDLTAMMLRDRNHPSVIMWSIGNEIPNWSVADASRIGKMLTAKVRELDPTRPVTQGVTRLHPHRLGPFRKDVRTFGYRRVQLPDALCGGGSREVSGTGYCRDGILPEPGIHLLEGCRGKALRDRRFRVDGAGPSRRGGPGWRTLCARRPSAARRPSVPDLPGPGGGDEPGYDVAVPGPARSGIPDDLYELLRRHRPDR